MVLSREVNTKDKIYRKIKINRCFSNIGELLPLILGVTLKTCSSAVVNLSNLNTCLHENVNVP